MYKDGKHWVAAKISTVAGVALFSTMILGGGHVDHVSADSVSASQVSRVTSSASSAVKASVATRDTKQAQPQNLAVTSSSKAAINVDVPHSGLDSAVANAKKDGVQVTQGATQSSSADANHASSAESSIANDYKNQTNAINQADAKQKQINETNSHAKDTVDHSGLDSAVKNAQSVGVNVSKGADQQVNGSASDWQDKENQIKSDYQNQINSLNNAINQQKKVNDDNSHIGNEGDHSALDNEVNKAKQAGMTVVQDSDQNVGSDKNASQWQDVDNQINSDYQNQVNDIQKALDEYQAALTEYNNEMKQWQIEDDNWKKENSVLTPEAQANLDKLTQALTGNAATPQSIKNSLFLGEEPHDTLTYKILQPDKIHLKEKDAGMDGDGDYNLVFTTNNDSNGNGIGISGDFIQFTYSNLQSAFYNGQNVSKIVVTESNLQPHGQWVSNVTAESNFANGMSFQGGSVDVKYQFYDKDGNLIKFSSDAPAYLTITSINDWWNQDTKEHPNLSDETYGPCSGDATHVEYAKALGSNEKAVALKGSTVTVHDGTTLYSDGTNGSDLPDGTFWDSNDNPLQLYGSGLIETDDGDSINVQFGCMNNAVANTTSQGMWWMPQTLVPGVEPAKPVKPDLSKYTIHYHYDKNAAQKENPVSASYHYDDMNLTPLAPVKASYHYDTLGITPVETKDVDANGQSVNGKDVVKGEDVTFPLSSAPLPANRTDDVKTLSFTDTLDKNVKFDGWKAVDAKGNDVSKDFTMSQNGQTITFTATQDFMNQINSNKSSQFDLPTIDIAATATASGVTVNNTFDIHVNGNAWPSNKVTFSTPGTPKPVKTVDNTQGQSVDGGFVEPGQEVDFNLTFDLSGDKNVVLDKNTIAKGLSISDNMDKRLTPNINGIKITDANGKEVNKDLFNITDNNNQVVISVKDPQAFLNTYGGQKLNIFLPAKVNEGITGNIPNTAKENHFDDDANTNQVIVYVPAPKKDVVAGTVQGTSSASINGEDVVAGQKVTFTLGTTPLPAGRKVDIKNYSVTDELDPNFDYSGFRAFLGSKDVTDEFTPSLVKGQDGKWTLTLTANADMLKQMNADKSKAFTIPTFDIYGSAINSGVKIQNTYTEHINNESYNSNTVSITTTPKETPVKTVTNAAGQDADNGNAERGDSLIYHVSMDLDGMPSNMVLTPDTIQKGLWVSDKMPAGVTVNTSGIRVNSADGKDVTSDFTITYQDGVVKVAAKDPASIIKQFGNTKLSITIPTTVNDNFTGDIKNTAIQNTFGNETESNTVVDHVPPMAPSKDVVVDLGNQNSLNGKSIALNSTFDYKLNSSTRPADYVGQTTEWGGKDMIDVKHDEFTGQWQVIADHPFVLKDGTTIKAGSDISKYFTMTFNDKTGEFDIEANKDFLDIMNLPANKKTAQGWSVFFQCKRIATGTAHNVWTETYNGKPVKSNTVTTTTPEPKKPATPAKPAPQPQKVVEKQAPVAPAKPASAKATPVLAQPVLATPAPVKETPAPEKQAMPQTGESENDEGAIIGLAMLGAVGTMGLALKKKRFED